MRALFLSFIFIILYGCLNAQDNASVKSKVHDTRKNGIYAAQDFFLTFSINYERLFSVNEKISIGIRGGLGRDGGNKDNTAIAGTIFRYGRSRHFFEAGIAYQQPNLFEKVGDDHPSLAFMAGYRYQAPGGFLFKVYPEFLPDLWPEEGSWGSLPFLGFALGYSL